MLPWFKLPRCIAAMQRDCVDHFDAIDCQASVDFCNSELSTGYWASGKSPDEFFCLKLGVHSHQIHRAERV